MVPHSLESSMPDESVQAEELNNRRREARITDRHGYTYELCECRDGGTVTVQQGQALSLNRSAHGILLLMSAAPRVTQLVELYNAQLGWRRSTMVYEVRWSRPLRVESQGDLFLVGCRLTTATAR